MSNQSPDFTAFSAALEVWFSHHARDFPWRKVRDPYKVWISEIMSQQTQIDRVAGSFYPRFLEKFPTVQDLAQSNWKELYPYWKGLGFYGRGKNMLKCAQMIVNKFEGKFPKDFESLQTLPGVGAYTAAAILSFAWDVKIPAIDTNISQIIKTLWPGKNIAEVAQKLIKASTSGHSWNSAMMDLATLLRSGDTKAIDGELAAFFPSEIRGKFIPRRKNTVATKPRKKYQKIVEVGIACIHQGGKYLIQTRPEGKSFVGSWEFPGGKREKGEDFRECVKREVMEEIGVEVSVRPHFYEEIFEFKNTMLRLRFHRCQIQAGAPKPLEEQQLDWVSPDNFEGVNFLETNKIAVQKLKEFRG